MKMQDLIIFSIVAMLKEIKFNLLPFFCVVGMTPQNNRMQHQTFNIVYVC